MPPYAPYSFMPLCVFGGFACCGGCNGLPFVLRHLPYITPVWGCLPFNYIPTLSHWFPVHQYVSGISVCYVGISLLSGRVWGCFPLSWGWGHQHLRCPYAHSCTFFVVHLCLTFWLWLWTTTPPVIVVFSGLSSMSSVTVAPSLTGFPVSLDQHGMVPSSPLMPRGSEGFLGSVSVPQQ